MCENHFALSNFFKPKKKLKDDTEINFMEGNMMCELYMLHMSKIAEESTKNMAA